MVTQGKTKKVAARKRPAAKPKNTVKKTPVKTLKNISLPDIPDNYTRDLGELAKLLKENPAVVGSIRDVLDYHLVDPINRKTFPRIMNAMSMLLGSKVAMAIIIVCHMNTPSFFDAVQTATKNNQNLRGATDVVKYISSIYGDRIQRAYTLSTGTVDEDWNSIDINTYKREGDEPVWMIDLKVSLYNGEEAKIKMIPNSAFQLIGILMREFIEKVPSDQVDPELLNTYQEIFSEFNALYHFEEGKEKNNHPEGYA